MKSFFSSIALLTMLFFSLNSYCQVPNYNIRSGIGIQLGVTSFNINTDNFETSSGSGWIAGLHNYAQIEHRWYDISYNMNLTSNSFSIAGREFERLSSDAKELEYEIIGAQIGLMMHAKPLKKSPYFTIDYGAFLQVNGEMKVVDEAQEEYFINNYTTLQAEDIKQISPLNLIVGIGTSASISRFKVKVQYLYGVNNTFSRLNKEDELSEISQNSDFSKFLGHWSQIYGAVVFYL